MLDLFVLQRVYELVSAEKAGSLVCAEVKQQFGDADVE